MTFIRNTEKPWMINLWAPPGVGKSTTAAMVFNILKHNGYRAELALEFAKDVTYEQNWKAFQDAFFVASSQERRNSRLIGEVDIIVTDSPPGLTIAYASEGDKDTLRDLVHHWRNRYRNVDWYLTRDPEKPYHQYGRTQTLEESTELGVTIEKEMRRLVANYSTTMADKLAPVLIADAIIKRMERHG